MTPRLLKSNSQVPRFNKLDYTGNTIDLDSYKGQKILLSFFRGASCPFCNLRVHELINIYPELKKAGVEVIVFFAASKDEILRYAGKQEPPFAIIPDPELEVYKLFDIRQSYFGMIRTMMKPTKMIGIFKSSFFNVRSIIEKPLLPMDFVLDSNLTIEKAYYGDDFGDHLPIKTILSMV